MLQIVYEKVADLVSYDKNPRINDMAVEPVAKSIKEFGFRVPVVIDANKVIVCGHPRSCRKASGTGNRPVHHRR